MRYEIIKAARVKPATSICHYCTKLFPEKEAQVDHVVPVGKLRPIDIFVNKLFFSKQVVTCKPCHKDKTKRGL